MRTARESSSPFARAVCDLAAQDWLVGAYLVVMLGASAFGAGPRREHAVLCASADLALYGLGMLVVRARLLGALATAVLYRSALLGAVLASFLQLHWILPAATTHVLDGELHALDLAVLGFEPATAFDALVTRGRTEWFSFFYFGYFPFLLAWIVPAMLLMRDRRLLAELSFGILWVFCVGQALYLLVPGHGPYVHLAASFRHPLEGEVFWPLVQRSVEAVELSARTDIFPSLHTAAPTFLTVFALRHRARAPFRWVALPCLGFASQVVLATMYLRWHYAVDVAVGLFHGISAAFLAARVAGQEEGLRRRLGSPAVWPLLGRGAPPADVGRAPFAHARR